MEDTKRNRSPASPPAAAKKIRADSHAIDDADLTFINDAADGGFVEELFESAIYSNDSHAPFNPDTKYSNTEDSSHDTPPKKPFSAHVTLNGVHIGKHTEKKIVLSVTTVKDEYGSEIFLSKPGKRILRISDKDTARGDTTVTMPREPCSNIEITFTSQGCRVIVDGEVESQVTRDLIVPEERLAEIIAKSRVEDKLAVVGPDNEWMTMYKEWREWTSRKMHDLHTLTTFPRMPEKARRCKEPECSRKLPDNTPRPFRHIDHCRHDIEMWFQDAAGGYNDTYYEMARREEMRWNPTKFAVLGKNLTPMQQKFRTMSGEIWKNALAMVDDYKEYMGYD